MINEVISLKTKTTKLTITNTEITAILKSDDVKTGMRTYSDGCIGVSSAIGTYDEEKLKTESEKMLSYNIPYDCSPTENMQITLDLTKDRKFSEDDFLKTSEQVLESLRKNYPDFMFSHEILSIENEVSLKNSIGTDLRFKDRHADATFLIKHRSSKNLMDSFSFHVTRDYGFENTYKTATEFCDFYDNKLDIEQECKMPVIALESGVFFNKFLTDLNGRQFGTGTSLFSGKLGQKLFSDDFSLFVDRNPEESFYCFFDGEGTTLPDKRFMLIENGVLKAPFSSKRTAKKYNLPQTSSAQIVYDTVPDTSDSCIKAAAGNKTIKELLGGRKAIYVVMASGGDFTSQGEFATPVQAAYIFDGERIYGRLPQIALSSNIFDMFGKDFIGISSDGNTNDCTFKYWAANMTVRKIGGHI